MQGLQRARRMFIGWALNNSSKASSSPYILNCYNTLDLNSKEITLRISGEFEKDEILEAYLNEVFLGQDGERSINGFGMASIFYFNKPLIELKPHQTALLVGLVKGPSYYDPRRHPDRAVKRRNLVLDEMHRLGFLPDQQRQMAKRLCWGLAR